MVEHPTPPQVIACVKAAGCDIAFMLIDPARAAEVNFTPAFVRSDFTYLVPAGSALGSAADVDRPGIRVAAVRGHASTIALVRLLKQAQPVYADTYDPTFELLRSGNADAFGSIREMLIQYSAQLPGLSRAGRQLPDQPRRRRSREGKGGAARLCQRVSGRAEAFRFAKEDG